MMPILQNYNNLNQLMFSFSFILCLNKINTPYYIIFFTKKKMSNTIHTCIYCIIRLKMKIECDNYSALLRV